MLLPDLTDSSNTVRHLVVGAGKDGNIYLVDRDSMGKFNASSNNNLSDAERRSARRHLVDAGVFQRYRVLRRRVRQR